MKKMIALGLLLSLMAACKKNDVCYTCREASTGYSESHCERMDVKELEKQLNNNTLGFHWTCTVQ